jgi:hypothetical protein
MKPIIWSLLAAVLVLEVTASALADLAPPSPFRRMFPQPQPVMPKPAPPRESTSSMVIEISDDARAPRLQIPQTALRASLENGSPDTALVQAEEPADQAGGRPRGHTVVAGLCLSLSLAFGGLWMVNQRGQFGKRCRPLGLGAVLFLGAGGAIGWADMPAKTAKPLVLPLGDKVTVEFAKTDQIRLIVSKQQFAKLVEKAGGSSTNEDPGDVKVPEKKPAAAATSPRKFIELGVEGLTTVEDRIKLRGALTQVEGVKSVTIERGPKGASMIWVYYDENAPALDALLQAITNCGFKGTKAE